MWVADFETLTYTPTRVWLWGAIDVETNSKFFHGNSLDSFMEWCYNKKRIYFHNLKFDGTFIVDWLMRRGFKYVEDKKQLVQNSFSSLISVSGIWYAIYIRFNNNSITILDSLKKLPMSVKTVANAYKLQIKKGEIDYNKFREIGYKPTKDEIEYVFKDVSIIAQALKTQFDQGLKKMTNGADALNFYKLNTPNFKDWFPQLSLEEDAYIRKSYKGGYVFLNQIYKNKIINNVFVYDVNSMYPYVMKNKPMPYGNPVYFNGEYTFDKDYDIYIIKVSVMFKLKEGYIPTIQLKGNWLFSQTEYIRETDDLVELNLTSIDFELFKKHYNILEIHYLGGYKFRSYAGFFNEYIDYWMGIKENSVGGIRTLAKLMLNSLYGKFAKNPDVTQKTLTFDEEYDIIKLVKGKQKIEDSLYVPVGSFITSWARHTLISAAQENYENFIYCDTDSLHMTADCSDKLDVHPTRLGAWKLEGKFRYAKFIRAKCYIEVNRYHIKCTCAGMPDNVKKKVRFKNFKEGSVFDGKLVQRIVPGGAILKETTFKIMEG